MAWLTLKAIFTGLRPIKTGSGTVFASIRKAIEYGNVGPIHLIDVGASDGWFTDGISREINIASVTCYEPLPDTWPTPTLGKATNKCVFRHLCVGNAVGKVIILQSNHSGLSSVLGFHNKYQYKFGGIDKIETIEKREVDMVTLDSDTHHHLSNKIVLKIDTQGYEMEVLKGAANLLSSGKVLIIVLELMLKLKYESQTKFEEIFPFLSSFGFEVYDIQKGYIEPSGQVSELDIVLCHNNLFKIDINT
jgi:FkbM family methyltransferase